MNRHERRRSRKLGEDKFYKEYLQHLPQLGDDEPLELGRLYHVAVLHDDWCAIFNGGGCNCHPTVERYEEPRRS
jgi:hypothetical protein